MKTGTSDPAAYPFVSTIVTDADMVAFSAVTTASEKVVHAAVSAGVPPLKWYRFDHRRVPPRKLELLVTFRDGVGATLTPYHALADPEVLRTLSLR